METLYALPANAYPVRMAITVFGGIKHVSEESGLPSHHRQDIPHLMPVHYWRI